MFLYLIFTVITSQLPFISSPIIEKRLKPMTNGRIWVRGKSIPKIYVPKTLQALKIIETELFKQDTSTSVPTTIKKTPIPKELSWLKGMKYPDIPIVFSPQTIKYLKFYKFKKIGRAIIKNWIERSYKYRAMLLEILKRHKLPTSLLYIGMIESAFSKTSHSYAGALGLWQLMPDNADVYGLERNFWVDQRINPELSSEAVTYYFKDLFVRFGNWHTALAAYNCGYGRMLQSIRRYGTNSYWELSKYENALPRETRLYIPKMLAVAIVDLNRDKFGIKHIKPSKPYSFHYVYVPKGTHLKTIAKLLNTDLKTIWDLNREYKRKRVPPLNGVYPVRIPVDSKNKFKKTIKYYSDWQKYTFYTVTFGDSLKSIAKSHFMSVRKLRKLNGIKNSTSVSIGTTLLVKKTKSLLKIQIEYPKFVSVPKDIKIPKGTKRYFYKTKKIDTLQDIANSLHLKVKDLAKWNKLIPMANITYSMYLQVFLPKNTKVPPVLFSSDKTKVIQIDSEEFIRNYLDKQNKIRIIYKFKKHDTLKKIARRFGSRSSYIRSLNNKWKFKEGDKLIIYAKKKKLNSKLLRYYNQLSGKNSKNSKKPELTKKKLKNIDKKSKSHLTLKAVSVKSKTNQSKPKSNMLLLNPVFVSKPKGHITYPYKGDAKYNHAKIWLGKISKPKKKQKLSKSTSKKQTKTK